MNYTMRLFFSLLITLSLTATLVYAQHDHSNGLDPSMDGPMALMHGHMTAFLHFTPGDTLWFDGWVPGKSSTLFAACLGLFMLGVAERWATALTQGVELAIAKDISGKVIASHKTASGAKTPEIPVLRNSIFMRGGTVAPFIVEHAWARFILHGALSTFKVLFMLAIMTYQVAFILSIVIGLGVGEMMYGRFADAARAELENES